MAFTRTSITAALTDAFEKEELGNVNLNERVEVKPAKVNEELMPMDKSFVKEWESSCNALLNHMKNNYDDMTDTGDRKKLPKAYKWLVGAMKDIDEVKGHATQMSEYFGEE